ncbi:DegV family protein [Dokdonella sp.]|uniref:DegV family protein n=1 Tax=Dokdonella sp. TaxID=2291710 RepID=UPI001B073326|nr:DegV family protein [Dokdonella sp.]MBO9661734.1 DegV family protein [Dokdonella sp.]
MRIGIVVDSACDLPAEFLQQHEITVLPIGVHLDGETLVDDRSPEVRQRFLDDNLGTRGHAAETEPYSADQIRDLFLGRLVLDYDCVFCLTITATRSPIHANASRASYAILKDYRPIRQAAGVPGPFLLRVIDTENLFAAQGVTAVEAVRLRAAGQNPGQMRERIELIARNTYGYMLPRDLYYLRARAQKKGDRSVGWFSAALGTALDIKPLLRGYRGETGPVAKLRGFEHGAEVLFGHAAQRVRAGLLTPILCVSYGGDLADLAALPGYAELKATCAECAVEVYESPMSVTGMINVGTGAVTLGFAAEEYAF